MAIKQERWLICGGTTFTNFRFLCDTMDDLVKERGEPAIVIHGAAPGADTIADKWATFHGYAIMKYPANWKDFGKSAGPIRNGVMIKSGKPTLGIAFEGNRGTANMVMQLHAAGIKVLEPKEK